MITPTPEVRNHIREAVAHQLRAWDSLRAAEQGLNAQCKQPGMLAEITIAELSDLAGGIDKPEDVAQIATDAIIDDWLNEAKPFGGK